MAREGPNRDLRRDHAPVRTSPCTSPGDSGRPPPNRPHAADDERLFIGDSTAWRAGDTLVIDTIGHGEWVLDAYHDGNGSARWHGDQAHGVARLRFIDRRL